MLENETNLVSFSCQAIGDPAPIISWYFNGVMINISDASKYNVSSLTNGTTVTSLLTIMNTQSSDVGTYTCFAENIIGSDQSSGVLTVNGNYSSCIYKFILSQQFSDAAEILEPLGQTDYIVEGNNFAFRCVGVGYPPPLVQWSKVNGSLSDRTSTTSMSMLTNEGNVTNVTVDLIFTGTYRDDTGVYECSVSNLLNTIQRDATLIVQCMLLMNSYLYSTLYSLWWTSYIDCIMFLIPYDTKF